jgi:hypothetical protein
MPTFDLCSLLTDHDFETQRNITSHNKAIARAFTGKEGKSERKRLGSRFNQQFNNDRCDAAVNSINNESSQN